MNETVIAQPGGQVVWGYVIAADRSEDEVFIPRENEADARLWVERSVPGLRKLAKRTLGPVEVVS